MSELHRALAEIRHIRCQVARDTQFRGYGPASVAASGMLALVVAALESHWPRSASVPHEVHAFVAVWVATAFLSLTMVTIQTMFRARRVHSGLATEMVLAAAEQFLPALVVGTLLTAVVLGAAPKEAWMLPGLWQLLFSLGVFASCRFLPRITFAVGVWYLISGLTTLIVQGSAQALLPWTMGIPFGVGQLLVAAVFQYGYERNDEA